MILDIAQLAAAIILIVLILLQERSSGLSSIFGGGGDSSYQTRRGLEKAIFTGTIVCAALFVALTLFSLIKQ